MTRFDPAGASRRELWTTLLGGLLLSCIVSYRVATRALVLGWPGGGWVYEYLYGFQPQAIAVFAIVWASCAVLATVSFDAVKRHEWRVVLLWLIAGALVQILIRHLTPFSLGEMFASDGSNGFYGASLQQPAGALLRDFDRVRLTFDSVHARGNMPGKLLLVQALELASSRPAVLAWLIVALSNLGGVFLYLFVRDYLDDRVTALVALVFYLLVPAKLVFFPVLNVVTPTLVLASAWLWLRLLRSRSLLSAGALGVLAYAIVLYEPTPAVMGLLFVVLTVSALWRGEVTWRTALRLTFVIGAGFAAAYTVMLVWFGFDLVSAVRAIRQDAVVFNMNANRPYGGWVAQNLLDILFGAGICQAVLLCWATGRALVTRALAAHGAAGRMSALTLGTAGALLAADLAGVNRGEVVRLWIFLACFAQVPAAYVCARLDSRLAFVLILGATLLQTALSTSMLAFAQP